MCRRCADLAAVQYRELCQRLFEDGICYQHREQMSVLELCPACRYETTEMSVTGISFEGLLPPPASGNALETCAGCVRCGRCYHKGSNYYRPKLPTGLKLRDEHLGPDGTGLWLRLSRPNEQGLVLIEHEACSLPDDKCTTWSTRKVALITLREYRNGYQLTGACRAHTHDRQRLAAAVAVRLRPQFGDTQNGNGQKNGGRDKHGPGRTPKAVEVKQAEACQLLLRIKADVLSRKANSAERADVTADCVAAALNIGGPAGGGDAMMKQLSRGGVKIAWRKLRDGIWDNSTGIQQLFLSSHSTGIHRINS
jgi:hypothetical protein